MADTPPVHWLPPLESRPRRAGKASRAAAHPVDGHGPHFTVDASLVTCATCLEHLAADPHDDDSRGR